MATQIPEAPEVPILGEEDFSSKIKAFHKWEKDELQPKANQLAEEVNVNADKAQSAANNAETYKNQADEYKDVAAASANYVGEWQNDRNYNVGESVSYNGSFYRVKQSIVGSSISPDQDSTHFEPIMPSINYQPFTLADIATMLRALALPFEIGIAFRGISNFNSTAGQTIALPFTFSNTKCYTVSIMPLVNSGFIGEIYIEKSTNSFTVYCTGSDNETQFEYTILITDYLNKIREV